MRESESPLTASVDAWPTAARVLDLDATPRPGLVLSNRFLSRDGRPEIPVSGELHYSRIRRARWEQRLRAARSGGVTVISSYVPWLHHVETRGDPRFDGNRDIAAFVDLTRENGLETVLRIGPWIHGETRNGGFPDWVQALPVEHRTDDPGYLEVVAEWFGQLAEALGGRASADRVLAMQVENELYTQPGHIATLKRLAREAGLDAALWTATGWGGAQLPARDVVPLFGGYPDGFWVDADAGFEPGFHSHYLFSDVRDDASIGADLREAPATPGAESDAPFLTCELGGGMAAAYHRRPRPSARDVAAVAHTMLGNGSVWQGYYMYAGGTNPRTVDGTQESHATGYPNDLPRLDYDFHAPISEAGPIGATHSELRRQHAFLHAFGAELATFPSSLPDVVPDGVDDRTTLRWAIRAADGRGVLFIAWHEPFAQLGPYRGARFEIRGEDGATVFPDAPIAIPGGTLARWLFGWELGGVRIGWATASALTILDGEIPTLVLTEDPGVEVRLAFSTAEFPVEEVIEMVAGPRPRRLGAGASVLDVLVVPAQDAADVWVREADVSGPRRLFLSPDEVTWGAGPELLVRTGSRRPVLREYLSAIGGWASVELAAVGAPRDEPGRVESIRDAGRVPASWGDRFGRASAPSPEVSDPRSAVHRVALPSWVDDPAVDPMIDIDWAGDVAELRIDGVVVRDRFWDGSPWTVSLRDVGAHAGSEVTVHLLPLAPDARIHLPAAAEERRRRGDGDLCGLDGVRLWSLVEWR